MKKLLLTLVTLVTATAASAQIVIWNGEDKTVDSDGGFWWRSNPKVVEEGSNKCLQTTLKSEGNDWEMHNIAIGLGEVNFKGLRRITLKMKMAYTDNVKVKLGKDGDGGYTYERIFYYGTANTWQTLVFEYGLGADNITDTGNTYLEIWPF